MYALVSMLSSMGLVSRVVSLHKDVENFNWAALGWLAPDPLVSRVSCSALLMEYVRTVSIWRWGGDAGAHYRAVATGPFKRHPELRPSAFLVQVLRVTRRGRGCGAGRVRRTRTSRASAS